MNKTIFKMAKVAIIVALASNFSLSGCDKPAPPTPDPENGKEVDPVNPENPDTIKKEEENPDTTFSLNPTDVSSFFKSSLEGNTSSFLPEQKEMPLNYDDYSKSREMVWKLWKEAVYLSGGETLPAPKTTTASWGASDQPADAVWKVPEGNMKIFYKAKGSKPADGYPLFLFLHGSGDADSEWINSRGWASYFNDTPSVYCIPRSPQGGTGVRWYQPSKQAKWEQLIRIAMLDDQINPNKIYFMGISEGAYGSQRLASFYADYLAGAGPIAGGELFANCPPENLANTAFCLQTGELDTDFGRKELTARVGKTLDALAASHPGYYKHKVDLQYDWGHSCDYTITTPWLRTFSRNPYPKYFVWENYGMGNINGEKYRYRTAFHNLRLLSDPDSHTSPMNRVCYEMLIEDNTINLTVRNVKITTTDPVNPGTGTMNMGVNKTYTPCTKGKLRLYLNPELVDLQKPVKIILNGKEIHNARVKGDMRHLVESCALFFDRMRLFPAAVDIDIQ